MIKIGFNEFCKGIKVRPDDAVKLLERYHDNSYENMEGYYKGKVTHRLILCALSLSDVDIKTMFEIGTCAGNCARLCANLFDKVETLDMEDYDGNKEAHLVDLENAKRILSPHKNVITYLYDSTELSKRNNNRYDLIFVDGNHFSPVVDSDIRWAYSHFNKVILFDDVFDGDKTDVYRALQSIEEESQCEVRVIKKVGFILKGKK